MQAITRRFATFTVALAAFGLLAVPPITSRPTVQHAAVRLASSGESLLSDLTSLGGLTGDASSLDGLSGLDSLTNELAVSGTQLSSFLDSGISSLDTSLDLGGVTSGLSSTLTSELASLTGASSTAGLENIPYNVLADLINIPNNESLGLQEYAYALGPADTTGGVPGWIPPGATVADGGVSSLTDQYTLGGTGSYYDESVGNTWGWDDGNFPQLDGIASLLVPYPALTQPVADDLQAIAQAEIVDGASVDCEFECANWFDYVGGWFHTPLSDLTTPGYTYPDVLEIPNTGNTSVDTAGVPGDTPNGLDVIWSGQSPGPLQDPLESVFANLTASPASDPIDIVDPATLLTNLSNLSGDLSSEFDPFITGSFLYWGVPTDYSIPAFLGGMLQDLTGIPNQFAFANDGAEPADGPTADPSTALAQLPQAFEYLLNGNNGGIDPSAPGAEGLLGYLEPGTYLTALSNDASALGLSGLNAAGGTVPTDVSGLAASLDPSASLGSSVDLSALLGPLDASGLASDLSADLPNLGTLGATDLPDLALNLLTLF